MKEIVGARIGGTITNDIGVIIKALNRNTPIELLDRLWMQLMAYCDLGRKWELMATGPTLFCIDQDGKPCAPVSRMFPADENDEKNEE